jgi:hypothetical protein
MLKTKFPSVLAGAAALMLSGAARTTVIWTDNSTVGGNAVTASAALRPKHPDDRPEEYC